MYLYVMFIVSILQTIMRSDHLLRLFGIA